MKSTDVLKELEYYGRYLREKEVNTKSVDQYVRDVTRFLDYMAEQKISVVDKESVLAYKRYLRGQYKTNTINSYLGGLNRFFYWVEKPNLTVKAERVQKRYSLDRVMSVDDYYKLLAYTKEKRKWKYYYIMRTLASTGIRVGELKAFTVEAVQDKKVIILHKNKVREIYLPDHLCHMLLEYAQKQEIKQGCIFTGSKKKFIGCYWNLENIKTFVIQGRCQSGFGVSA